MNQDAIEGHAVAIREEPAQIVERVRPHALAMLDATTPEEFMDRLGRVCKILVDVVEKQKLAKRLGQGDKKHVEVEAWQFLASMPWIRCTAVIDWTKEIGGDGSGLGWEARTVVYRDGEVVGAGEAMCLRSERNWKSKDYFSLRSMAQTRSISRALQGPLRFVFVMAGYSGAGAEEMPDYAAQDAQEPPSPPARVARKPQVAAPAPVRARDSGSPGSHDPVEKGRALDALAALRRERFVSPVLYQELLKEVCPHHASPRNGTVADGDLSVEELRQVWRELNLRTKGTNVESGEPASPDRGGSDHPAEGREPVVVPEASLFDSGLDDEVAL